MKAKPKKNRTELCQPLGFIDSDVPTPIPDYLLKFGKSFRRGGAAFLPFSSSSVKIKRDFISSGRREIPRITVKVNPKVEIEIFGSHLETESDRRVTHLVYNPSSFQLLAVEETGVSHALYSKFLVASKPNGWKAVFDDESLKLAGEAAKTVFQGVADDPDLPVVLNAVEEIRGSTEDFVTAPPPPLNYDRGIEIKRQRIGEQLLDFLVPLIRNPDFKKLQLLEKCIRYLQSETKTKMDRMTGALCDACEKYGRIPTAPELFSWITNSGYQLKEARFYSDLCDVGLGWLTRKNRSIRTPVGNRTK